jgi:hypothetical protein
MITILENLDEIAARISVKNSATIAGTACGVLFALSIFRAR